MDAGLGPATIGGLLSCVRKLLRYGLEVRRLSVLTPEKVRRPKVPIREVEFLTKDEVRRFLDAFPQSGFSGMRDRALAGVLCATGMRISEALSLDREAMDWMLGEATVIGKGRKQRRVYFNEAALEWLLRYLHMRNDDHPALFVTQNREVTRLRPAGVWRRFKRYAVRAGLSKRVYPHMLRHTMATTLLNNGCPIGHIRVLLGHAHLATTCRYYLGRIAEAEAKAAHEQYLWYEERGGGTDPSPGR
jgi:integrase/recombinase XerD